MFGTEAGHRNIGSHHQPWNKVSTAHMMKYGKIAIHFFSSECGQGQDERQVLADGLLQADGWYPVSIFTIFFTLY